jgi:hypothetical protein
MRMRPGDFWTRMTSLVWTCEKHLEAAVARLTLVSHWETRVHRLPAPEDRLLMPQSALLRISLKDICH